MLLDTQTIDFIKTCFVPVIVAVIGYLGIRYQKRSEKEKKLREELEAAERKKNDEMMERIEASILSISTRIDSVAEAVNDVQDETTRQRGEIDKLAAFTQLNLEQNRQISGVVTAVAEGLRDNNIDGNVTKALERFREFEDTQMNELYIADFAKNK